MQANASALVGNRLTLLLDDDLDDVEAAAARLRVLLPNLLVDKFVEYYPQVLDIDDFDLALQVWETNPGPTQLVVLQAAGMAAVNVCM